MKGKQRIGIIGVNSVSLDFAERLVKAGFEVFYSTTGCPTIFKDLSKFLNPKINSVSLLEATNCEIIILFLSKEKIKEVANELPKTKDTIIIYHNYLADNGNVVLKDVSGKTSSQILATILPNATIVDIFTPLEINTSNRETNKTFFYDAKGKENGEKVKQFFIDLNITAI